MSYSTTIEQATPVRAPANAVSFAKDHTPIAGKTSVSLLDAGLEVKTKSLDTALPSTQLTSAPQLTPPATLPGSKDTQILLKDLDKFGGLSLKFDEQRLLNHASDALGPDFNASSVGYKGANVPGDSVRTRFRALLFDVMNNKQKSQEYRSEKAIVAADLYTKVVKTKVDALYKQGTNGLTGSIGAAVGSGLIAGGGLWMQGKATTIKTDIVKDKETSFAQKQLLRDEQRNHVELKQKLAGGVMGNPKREAYEKAVGKVDADIIDARQKATTAGQQIRALKAENKELRSGLSLEEQLRMPSANRHPESPRVEKAGLRSLWSDDDELPSLDFDVTSPRTSSTFGDDYDLSSGHTRDFGRGLRSLKPSSVPPPQQTINRHIPDDGPPLPFDFQPAQRIKKIDSNDQKIAELRREKQAQNKLARELEAQKPAALQRIEQDHNEVVSLIKQEKEADTLVNMRHDLVNDMELNMEGRTIDAERKHTIGWTVVNLQSMSQMLQSGFGVAVKTQEGVATEQDAAINALQDQLQLFETSNTHDENAKDGLKNTLQENERSHNDTLKKMSV